MVIVCRDCGEENEDGATFCGVCGAYLEWVGERVEEPEPPVAELPPEPEAEPDEGRPGLIDRVRRAVGREDDDDVAAGEVEAILDADADTSTTVSEEATPPVAQGEGLEDPVAEREPTPLVEPSAEPPARAPDPATPPDSARENRTSDTGPPATSVAESPDDASLRAAALRARAVESPQPADAVGIKPQEIKPAKPRPKRKPRAPSQARRVAKPGDLICGRCGEPNDPARNFCRRCGGSLAEAPVAEADVPWWRRIFRRHPKVVAAGERPGRRGGSKSAAARSGIAKARSRAGRSMALVARVGAILTIIGVGALAVGPWRGGIADWMGDRYDSIRRVVAPRIETVLAVEAVASSSAAGHGPENLVQSTANRYWAEGARGPGIGESVTLHFATSVDIDTIVVTPGPSGEGVAFTSQPRPKKLRFTFSDGTSTIMMLADERTDQSTDVDANGVESVLVVILEAYPAAQGGGRDTSITDIEFKVKR